MNTKSESGQESSGHHSSDLFIFWVYLLDLVFCLTGATTILVKVKVMNTKSESGQESSGHHSSDLFIFWVKVKAMNMESENWQINRIDLMSSAAKANEMPTLFTRETRRHDKIESRARRGRRRWRPFVNKDEDDNHICTGNNNDDFQKDRSFLRE